MSSQSITTLLPAALAIFAITLGVFGGLSYGFYQFGASWTGLGFLIGLLGAFALLVASLRSFFGKFSGRMMFAMWLIAVLGAYFVYLFENGKYPMGIDLAGGTELIYRLDYSQTDRNIEKATEELQAAKAKDPGSKETRDLQDQVFTLEQSKNTAPDKAAEVVRKRVDPTGTKGIPVTTLGSDKQRLRIQLPRATFEEVRQIKEAIEKQGRLNFHIVTDNQLIIQKTKESPTKTYVDPETRIEYEVKTIKKPKLFSETAETADEQIVAKRVPELDGSKIILAAARHSSEGAGYEIGVRFSPTGSVEFGNMTEKHQHKRMAIVLDGVAHSAPTIQEPIYGECRISGSFTKDEAEKLAAVLQAGSLPAEVKYENEFTVGPTLGREQIASGMQATVIATGLVIMFMLMYYRLAGGIASFCTALNILMLLGAMGFFKATLTLPGIAGIVLTLGMSVDANVLILERIREEMQRGRSLKLAVTHGFDRAFLTIIDCNLTTLISAVVLYYLGTGPVRGFAVSLSIGILTTLFCNLWLNWIVMEWLVSRDALKNLNMMQIFKSPNYDFMKWRKPAYLFTGGTALASVVLMGVFSNRLFDVDFTGGTLIQFNFSKAREKEDDAIKKLVDSEIEPGVKKRSEELVAALNEAMASSKSEHEVYTGLAEKFPELSDVGKAGIPLKDELAKKSESIKKEIENFHLTAQSFGRPENGGKYRSFTITTRVTDTTVVNALDRQIKATFKTDLEPDAIVAENDSVSVRFESAQGLTPDVVKERVAKALLETAREPAHENIQDALRNLKVNEVKEAEGYLVAQVGPLPADAKARTNVVDAVETTHFADRAGGPISRKNSFGAQVADELAWQALWALLVANIGVFIYLWFRFEFSGAWGFGAIMALIHDVVLAAGGVVVANLLGFPILIDLNIIAALLTIIGFSVNDTIVTFDRIREVKAAHPTRAYEDIVNEAVNATLGRTILTATTVLLADLALLLFGGPTIQGMAWTLFVGFICGTYSSIFVASPLMIWWYRRFGSSAAPAAPQAPKPAKLATDGAEV